MSPRTVRAAEPGTRLGPRPVVSSSLSHVEAYFDVVHGKVAEITYGFAAGQLVHAAYRFTLKEHDRPFSQKVGAHLRSTYGESDKVKVSGEGRVLQLHWSTPQTTVIARFAPESLRIQFWETAHWTRTADRPAGAEHPER